MQTLALTAASPTAPLAEQLRRAEQALADSQALLQRMLPAFVLDRLMANPAATIADHFEDASVLFADIQGFVALARGLGNEATVALLDELTCAFDALADRHGVEKIKTIGDGYMAVAGVPLPQADHCERLVRLALDMQGATRRVGRAHGVSLKLRIGIARGPVTAGVIGTAKFAYDVWGDAVNLAARLEKLAPVGGILVSDAVRAELASVFDLTSRGEIEIRGYGADTCWIVEGPLAGAGLVH